MLLQCTPILQIILEQFIQYLSCLCFMDELRERRRQTPLKESSLPKVKSVVRRLDFFPKVDDDYVIRTNSGGYCGLCSFWR